jgi:hypothetical protein
LNIMQDIGADLERLQQQGQQFLGGDAARNRQIANATAMPGPDIGLNPQRVRDVAENGGGPGGSNLYGDGPSHRPPGPEVKLSSGPASRQVRPFNPWQGTNPEQAAALALPPNTPGQLPPGASLGPRPMPAQTPPSGMPPGISLPRPMPAGQAGPMHRRPS